MENILIFFESIPFAYPMARIFMSVVLFMFVMYSALIMGQTSTLRKTVVTEKGDLIYYVSVAQLVLAIAIFLLSLVY